ncbi:MAG: hypothetical protein RB294_10975, partial [Bacteroidales bacterium]|nr:hypothetical protein [Bacteroidales bacterium]
IHAANHRQRRREGVAVCERVAYNPTFVGINSGQESCGMRHNACLAPNILIQFGALAKLFDLFYISSYLYRIKTAIDRFGFPGAVK